MARVQDSPVSEALETLIAQFSQPLAFLRELVQNSLDAGTNRVDVAVRHDEAEGCAVVEVADTGEGMDRQVIDSQLTRLFSSSKEGDLTKIGKFGIGFVSVFAVNPKAVVVDTARGGEAWRVLFHPDRSFDRIRLDEPLEGTRVAVWVPMARGKLKRFREDCRDTVRFWCKHCEVDIAFDGEVLNEPFELPGVFCVRHQVPGTEVVVAPSPDDRPFCGFYNRGLTLLEGPGSPVPGIAFKVRSRYLEHTLTRDNVMQDSNYEKAMAIVRETADRRLPESLFAALEASPTTELWRAAACLLLHRKAPPTARVFPDLDGRKHALRDLREAVWTADPQDPLARAVHEAAGPVLLADAGHPMLKALAAAGAEAFPVADRWRLPRAADASPEVVALLQEAAPLFREAGFKHVGTAALEGPLCLRLRQMGRPQPVRCTDGRSLAVDPEHPLVARLVPLSSRDPGLAAYLLARAAMLELGTPTDGASDLLALAMKRRPRQ